MEPFICRKVRDDQECGAEIPIVKENFRIMKPEIPSITSICPECGNSSVLTKAYSQEIASLFFTEDIEMLLNKQSSNSGTKASAGSSSNEENTDYDDMLPSTGLVRKVENTFDVLGYKGRKAWTNKIKAVLDFVQTVPMYQTPQGLHQLLASWGVDVMHIPMFVQRVFGSADMQQAPNYGNMMGNQPGGYMVNGMQGQQQQQQYTQAQGPNGQVILIPNIQQPQQHYPYMQQPQQQPIIIDRSSNQPTNTELDETIITEKLGPDGKVISRTIRQPRGAAQVPQQQGTDIAGIISLLGSLGVFSKDTPPPQNNDSALDRMQAAYERQLDTMKQISENSATQIAALRDQMQDNEMNQIKGTLSQLADGFQQIRDRPPGMVTDAQAKISAQSQNISTMTGHLEEITERLVGPIAEGQKLQAKTQAAMTLRQMELEAGVPPGTYMRAIFSTAPTEEDVHETTQNWKQKAANMRKQQE